MLTILFAKTKNYYFFSIEKASDTGEEVSCYFSVTFLKPKHLKHLKKELDLDFTNQDVVERRLRKHEETQARTRFPVLAKMR